MNETHQVPTDLADLQKRINQLSPSEQLRLAAELLDRGKYSMAESITSNVVAGMQLLRITRTVDHVIPKATTIARLK